MRPPPQPATSAEPATWLRDRIGATADWVTGTVGTGFEAYARIFHPLGDEPHALRWRDFATRNGRTMHPSAQWEHVNCPQGEPVPQEPTGRGWPGDPDWGNLRPVFLAPLCDLLATHTDTPERCWFALWEGYGWREEPGSTAIVQAVKGAGTPPPIEYAPDDWQLDLSAPRFDMPMGRTYLLYQGSVQDAVGFGRWITVSWFEYQSPSLFWADDHAWCVASEIDFDTTLVGGTADLVESLVDSHAIEALQIAADAPFQDRINT